METKTKEVKLEWLRSRMFVGTDHLGNSIAIGYQREEEPFAQGINPSDLLLLAAASCSAYDVVQILEKSKQPLEDLKVDVTSPNKSRKIPSLYFAPFYLPHQRGHPIRKDPTGHAAIGR